jgi:hypothetical protein
MPAARDGPRHLRYSEAVPSLRSGRALSRGRMRRSTEPATRSRPVQVTIAPPKSAASLAPRVILARSNATPLQEVRDIIAIPSPGLETAMQIAPLARLQHPRQLPFRSFPGPDDRPARADLQNRTRLAILDWLPGR